MGSFLTFKEYLKLQSSRKGKERTKKKRKRKKKRMKRE